MTLLPAPGRLAGYATLAVWQAVAVPLATAPVDADALRPHAPESLWPSSWALWVALIGVAYSVIKTYRAERREITGPLEDKIYGARKQFAAEIARVERDVDHAIEEAHAQHEAMVNGLGDRVTRVERRSEAQDEFSDRVIAFMAATETHRMALATMIARLELAVTDGQKEHRAALADSERRIMAAIARRREDR